jgi:hypothetical protein
MRNALAGLAAVLVAAGCGGTEGDDDCPSADPSLWAEREPTRYVFASCGTGLAPGACSITAVQNGRVVASYDADETDAFEAPEPGNSLTLSDAFELGGCNGCDVRIRQNDQWGYVSEVYADCGAEGYGAEVTCFAPDTLDPAACR